MKKSFVMVALSVVALGLAMWLSACETDVCKDIELMGAGDRIHDTYTFANSGVTLKDMGDNKFEIGGSVQYLSDAKVKEEFNIDEDVNHVVAIKLSCCDNTTVDANNVEINVNGVRNYDAEHINGSDYTFVILEASVGSTTTITVKWNADADEKVYTIYMSENLELLPQENATQNVIENVAI
jgi:hypothetical protein